MTIHKQFTTTSTDGRHKLHVYAWLPDKGPCRAVLQILHGMREHMGRYADFASFCCSQGIAVYGHDHLGHGKTARAHNDYGYFGEQDGPRYLLADCKKVAGLVARRHPRLPYFLLGHSMGSFLGRLMIVRPPVRLSGFVCMGTGGELGAAPPARALLELVCRIWGDRGAARFLNNVAVYPSMRALFLPCRQQIQNMDWLSWDPETVAAFRRDPMAKPYFTNRGLCDLVTLQLASTGRDWAARVDPELPVLLLSGDRDVVGHNGKGVVETYERLQAAGCRNVTCKLYEGARHELLNERNREEVYFDLYQWMLRNMDSGRGRPHMPEYV